MQKPLSVPVRVGRGFFCAGRPAAMGQSGRGLRFQEGDDAVFLPGKGGCVESRVEFCL